MYTIIDYLGSLILGGALLGIILNANDIAAENQSMYNGDMLVQEMLVQTAHLIEGEFRNMGVGVPEDGRTILQADTSSLIFLYDADRDGSADTIRYSLGTTDELPGTQNELDRPLNRQVNSQSPGMVGVVTVFRLRYLDRLGRGISTPVASTQLTEIHAVEITMEVQNPYAMHRSAGMVKEGEREALYSSSLWQQTRLASQNVRR
ncbi:MAG: hypothetical protein KAJ12_04505 [Bacteroidetes bacterium]|nr:hypothetical protein [Bacteroidota bacterium]